MRSADARPERRSDAPRRRHDAGFTLIEVLVALAIMGLALATLSWALGPARDRSAVGRTLASFKEVAEVARERAIETGSAVELSIDTGRRSLDVPALHRSEQLPPQVDLTFTTAIQAIGRPERSSEKVAILFFPDGTSTGGRLTVRLGNAVRTAQVSWVSGASVDEP